MGNQQSSSFILPNQTEKSFFAQTTSRTTLSNPQKHGRKTITVKNDGQLQILRKSFDFRLRHRQFLAHMFGFEMGSDEPQNTLQKITCKTIYTSKKVTLHYQKVTSKFSDLYNLSIQQGSKLLAHCLKGFQLLFEQYGHFTPEASHIFKQGQFWVVWVSDNIFSVRNQEINKNSQNVKRRHLYWQKIIHIFDALRDEQNPEFSYSSYIYGQNKEKQNFPNLSFEQIFQKLNSVSLNIHKVRGEKSCLLEEKQSVNSSSTIKNQQFKINLSFDSNINDATLSKFKNNHKSQFKRNSLKNKQSICLKKENRQDIIQNKNLFGLKTKQNQDHQKQNIVDIKTVSSKLLKVIEKNKTQKSKETEVSRLFKRNDQSVTTLAHIKEQDHEVLPKINFGNQSLFEKKNNKRQRAITVDSSFVSCSCEQNTKLLDRKITQNSQRFQDQTENQKSQNISNIDPKQNKKHNFEVILQSPTIQNQEYQQFRATSISSNRKIHEEQLSRINQKYLTVSFKNQHKRSLTDQSQNLNADNKRIKLCLSQQFDSEFFSNCSKREIPSTHKLTMNYLGSKNQICRKMTSQFDVLNNSNIHQNGNQMKSQRNQRKANILDDNGSVNIIKDSILENNQVEADYKRQQQVSIVKLSIFKSEYGLKNLLGSKMGTLQSIKQIDVQVPIDEEILHDLNKMFPRHHFAKSTKNVK